MRRNWKWFLILLAAFVSAAVVAGVVYASGGVPAVGASPNNSVALSNCKVTKADFITNDTGNPSNTNSATFVTVPGMSTVVHVGGRAPSCVLVEVSGDSLAPSGEQEDVAVELDGNLGNPASVVFSMNDPNAAQGHAAVFAFPNVAPGNHTVAMQFKSSFGGTVSLNFPAMRIDHQ